MIPGLTYLPDFITQEKQDYLANKIDENTWLPDLKRRTQHYGYKYDYTSKRINRSMHLGPLPEWVKEIVDVLHGLFSIKMDQMIVNEYNPGQGIAHHIDCVPCFTDIIVSLSLLSSCEMNFCCLANKEEKSLMLDPGSLLVLEKQARYGWTHGIAARVTDNFQVRRRRLSMTFRKVVLDS